MSSDTKQDAIIRTPTSPLTPEEDERQHVAGKSFRKLLTKVVSDLTEVTKNDKSAIFLSGGADSASILLILAELGVKPECITYSIDGKMSGDAKKAQKLAAFYDLPFHIVQMPMDPDTVTRGIDEMLLKYPAIDMGRRPNIEVLFIMQEMFRFAALIGAKSVYSGIGDADVHLTGRSHEIAGRTRGLDPLEATALQVWAMEDDQIGPLSAIASDNGISLCAPITIATSMLPYIGLSWREMNIPRKKIVTLRAFKKELDEIDILIQPKPLQNGDSGAREYFDDSVAQSPYADERSGRTVDSAQMYYNSIARSRGMAKERGATDKRHNVWETWRKNVLNIAPTQKDYSPRYKIGSDGVAELPKCSSHGSSESTGLFDDVLDSADAEGLVLDESGKPDTRSDCFGIPFYTGEALTNCPRAQAGLCGTHHPEIPVVVEACQFFERWAEAAPISLDELAAACADKKVRKVYLKWIEKARNHAEKITENAREIPHGITLT